MKRRFEIIPIVESEIVPDQSLELIKGGGYITTCSEGYSCETYVNGHCSSNTCLKGYCYVCQELTESWIHSRDNERDSESPAKAEKGKGISLRGVDFKYDPNSSTKILDDVSLDIRPGKVTAIVGASGSGKTTLMKLMLGYYSPLAGKLEIEGKNLNDMDLPAWRKRCGVVMQNGVVFSDTIARNVAIADDSPDPGRLEEALRLANLLCFVRRLPLGAETVIGPDGLELSQGQKQRILIARAIYRDPEFIFLDEATNSLDSVNERGIVENMSEFGKGRTTVVIAHRLSTVNHADTIVVLEKGRVVETGDHAELIARRGTYYNLVKNQLELCD